MLKPKTFDLRRWVRRIGPVQKAIMGVKDIVDVSP
jgi:hypothetical protein